MNTGSFIQKIASVASRDTSADPDGWEKENLLWGHCAVVALLAQEVYGGEIVRGSLRSISKYKHLRSHYWNHIGGREIDFTESQFSDISFQDLEGEVRNREEVLKYPDTAHRYSLLKKRFDILREWKGKR